jgi:hypothetical protein
VLAALMCATHGDRQQLKAASAVCLCCTFSFQAKPGESVVPAQSALVVWWATISVIKDLHAHMMDSFSVHPFVSHL